MRGTSKIGKTAKWAAVAFFGAATLGGDLEKAAAQIWETSTCVARETENYAFFADVDAGRRIGRFFCVKRAAASRPSGRFCRVVDAEAVYREGREAAFGLNGTKIDGRRGVELLTRAAVAGSVDAQAELAELLLDGGAGAKIDAAQAYASAFEAARSDNPFALFVLGKCYYYGRFVAMDFEKARTYFARAFRGFEKRAASGDVRAKIGLATLWAEGIGVPNGDGFPDADAAFKLLREAADEGVPAAIAKLGFYYERGIGVEPDGDKAIELYRRAAEAGDAVAMRKLGFAYTYGINVARDFGEAIEWRRRAANVGDATATYELGACCFNGIGVSRDFAKATEYFRRAAEAGNAMAAYSLGVCRFRGIGVARNCVEASRYFRRAAEAGDVRAALRISDCYEKGIGVRRNPWEAEKWRRKSAETISFALPEPPNVANYWDEAEIVAPLAPEPAFLL